MKVAIYGAAKYGMIFCKELEAIKGAKEIISEQSPILAICLYHKPSHLWEIPLLINEINPNYDMYIRVYGHLGLETVLYCVPKG